MTIMTKGTRAFRTIMGILLGITILWTAFMSYAFIYVTKENEALKRNERFGLYVAGIDVTMGNAYDILGDGTVVYNEVSNVLTLNNATIECIGSAIYSQIDLTIELIGENKLICSGKELTYAIYASDRSLRKDIAITGDGSLEIAINDKTCRTNAGIIAEDIWLRADVSITLADATEDSLGINCNYMYLDEAKNLNIQVGAAENNSGISTRGGIFFDKDSVVNVLCSAATKESYGIECTGKLTAKENAAIHAKSGNGAADIVCYSVVLDYGAVLDAEIEAVNGILNK